MSETTDIPIEEIIGSADDPVEPGHDEWFRAKVKETLAKAKAGRLNYKTVDEIAEKFGFNAR